MGDPNASLPTPEPVYYRPMFGSYGLALPRSCVTFMSGAAVERGVPEALGLQRRIHAVSRCRSVTKADLVRNGTLADIRIDPETYEVRVDGEVATCEPARRLPLTQAYYIV
jgi:urease subunit alpha